MSQTSANVDANVNPVYADVVQVKLSEFLNEPDDLEMFEGWRNWSLQDIVRILKDTTKPEKYHGVTGFQWETLFSVSFWKQRRIRVFLSR